MSDKSNRKYQLKDDIIFILREGLIMLIGIPILAGYIVVSSLIGFAAGYLAKILVGGMVSEGMNYLFGCSRFTPDSIPFIVAAMCAILAIIKIRIRQREAYDNDRDEEVF